MSRYAQLRDDSVYYGLDGLTELLFVTKVRRHGPDSLKIYLYRAAVIQIDHTPVSCVLY